MDSMRDTISSIGNYIPVSNPITNNQAPILYVPTATTSGKQLFSSILDSSILKNGNEDMLELIAKWFLSKSSMSNKKLQKLCYYAYSWFIVFFNDLEAVETNLCNIATLSEEKFEAWIHGPVNPQLYHKYKEYGWTNIPQESLTLPFNQEIEDLLKQVLDIYGHFSADELETITHGELPWQNARCGLAPSEPCTNKISDYDILKYYSSLR